MIETKRQIVGADEIEETRWEIETKRDPCLCNANVCGKWFSFVFAAPYTQTHTIGCVRLYAFLYTYWFAHDDVKTNNKIHAMLCMRQSNMLKSLLSILFRFHFTSLHFDTHSAASICDAVAVHDNFTNLVYFSNEISETSLSTHIYTCTIHSHMRCSLTANVHTLYQICLFEALRCIRISQIKYL